MDHVPTLSQSCPGPVPAVPDNKCALKLEIRVVRKGLDTKWIMSRRPQPVPVLSQSGICLSFWLTVDVQSCFYYEPPAEKFKVFTFH